MKKLSGFFNSKAQAVIDTAATQCKERVTFAVQATDNKSDAQTGRKKAENNSAAVLINQFHEDFVLNPINHVEPDYALLVLEYEQMPEMGKETNMRALRDPLPSQWKDVFDSPQTYDEAWNHPDPWQREKWREAIRLEFKKMNDHKVWKKVPRLSMPPQRRCVKCKWIFEIKRNGTFCSRLVACGYSQTPGVDFTEYYSPVANEVTICVLLVAEIVWKLVSKIIDGERAFLHGDLEEEIYMDCPDGLDHEVWGCLQLLKTIYGLVQAARAFYKK
jgi:hypothetical protein